MRSVITQALYLVLSLGLIFVPLYYFTPLGRTAIVRRTVTLLGVLMLVVAVALQLNPPAPKTAHTDLAHRPGGDGVSFEGLFRTLVENGHLPNILGFSAVVVGILVLLIRREARKDVPVHQQTTTYGSVHSHSTREKQPSFEEPPSPEPKLIRVVIRSITTDWPENRR